MNKLKVILLPLVVFLFAFALAFYYENTYRILVRFFFTLFQPEKIKFSGKNFHLFASYFFVIGFGVYCSLLALLLYRKSHKDQLAFLLASTTLFFITTVMTTFADSTLKVLECTTCEDGIRSLHYNGINYDLHFISSLAISLLPPLWTFTRGQKKLTHYEKAA